MSDTFNAAEFLLDRNLDAGNGDRAAVICTGATLTYAQLHHLAAAFAGGLKALDVRSGERVLFVCSDRHELLAGILGAWRHGAVAVPVSTMLTAPELEKLVVDSGARVVAVSPEFADTVTASIQNASELAHVITVAGATVTHATARVTSWDELVGYEPLLAAAVTSADAPALWLYTSGTTGTPKAAMHRHANIRAVCETYARHVLQISAEDRCFSIAKLFFAYGLGNSALFPLSVGATTILDPRPPRPQVVAERMDADAPTLFFATPSFYSGLLAADLPTDTFASVRMCASAGEALPAALYGRFTERFGVDILDGIGSTEALHIFLSNTPGAVRPGTSGTPVPGYDIELRDENGQLVPDETPGALYVRGASIATGYWCRTDASRTVFCGEWLRTGDTYLRSPDGFYTCLGRSSDLLKAGGIWVSPAEVEARLLQHPAVAQAAVVGVPDGDELDKPVACVVVTAGATTTSDELIQWCRDGLAVFKRPRAVLMVAAFPTTATGKIQRFKLRELARQQLAQTPPAPGTPIAAATSRA
jgi:benzoate-CoA ligase family protein